MMNEWILSSSLLIAAVLVGRRLLRGKISLRLQYALWLVVLVRLLLPVQIFTSDFGTGAIARDVDISQPIRQAYVSVNEDRYAQAYAEAYRQVAADYTAQSLPITPDTIEKEAYTMVREAQRLDLNQLLLQLWIGGILTMTLVIVVCNLHLARQLRKRRWTMDIPDSLLPVYVTEAVPTPCIFGLFRPAIYLTPDAAKDETVRAHVLAHEQTHYRHGDHIWSVLRTLCLVLHWYNPLVWLGVKTSKIDAELACDEGVLARLGESHRGDYGRTLIGLTCSAPMGDFLLTATTMTGSAGSIRQRIRLLMARPRNTFLALTAVVLVGMLVVGCSFAGAPETTPPVTEPSESARDTLGLINADGILVFPGTRWNMTREEVLTALELTESDLDSFDNYQFTIPQYAFLGQNVDITFCFNRYSQANHFGFDSVMITFDSQEAADAVCAILKDALGAPLFETSDIGSYIWHSDTKLEELISGEAFEFWLTDYIGLKQEDSTVHTIPASSLILQGADHPQEGDKARLIMSSYLTTAQQIEQVLGTDPVEEVRDLLGENGDADALAALTRLWSGHYGIAESKHVAPFLPSIVDCVQADEDTVYVYYNRPGSAQLYQAELAPHAESWAVIDNVMVLSMADYTDKNLRELNEAELQQFRDAFRAVREDNTGNPAACFLATCYSDITQMDGSEFLANFPTDQEGTREEFELLKAKYPDFFGDWTWETMPLPIHRYNPKEIEAVVSGYGNIHWPELDEGVHYLDETGCYYNYTSDFGLGGFYARGGFVYDGGAVVYSGFSVLFFDETMGQYSIRAHLPAIVLGLPSSQPMIPVSDPRDPYVTALVTAFNRAYQENLYMGTDNPYDHLTVLAADPAITVTHQGQTLPLSDFYANIEYLHDKETWFHHTRNYRDTSQAEYAISCQVNSILYDDGGDTAIVVTSSGIVFADDDPAAPKGEGAIHKFLLVQVNGIWLVADVLADGEGFDLKYKDNPTFDVEKMIAERLPR